jgi:hypothetical protein
MIPGLLLDGHRYRVRPATLVIKDDVMPRSCSYDGCDVVHRSHPFSEIFPSAVC